MSFMTYARRGIAVVLAFAGTLLASAGPSAGAGLYPTSARGTDISWPQCGSALPTVGGFGIVGVTNGRAFSQNPCLAAEYQWAGSASTSPSLYMNLNAAIGTTADNGASGPAGNCKRNDLSCWEYNYGWNAAQATFAYALTQGASAAVWWLDIETANSWRSKTALNRRTIQGATDALTSRGAQVGIYSAPYAWRTITGSWQNGMPVWYAGTAAITCQSASSFTGGTVWLVQQASASSGGNVGC